MDTKTAKKIIVQDKDNGKRDQEIYNELSPDFPNKKNLALLITGTAASDDRNRYKLYNNILIGLLVLVVLLRLLGSFYLLKEGNLSDFAFSLIGLLFPALFIYGIAQYNAPFYRFCGFMVIVGSISAIARENSMVAILFDVVLIVAIAGLCFFLGNKMFPNYKPGKLKQDSNGNYLLQ
jgi:hypothetical protein